MAEKLRGGEGTRCIDTAGDGRRGKVVGNRCSAPISKTTLRRTALNRFTEQRTAEREWRPAIDFLETPSRDSRS